MTATPYLVTSAAAATKFDGVDAMVINANSSAEAKALAGAAYEGEAEGRWSGATVTSLATPPNDWEGFVLRARLTDNNTPFTVIDVSVTGGSGDAFTDLAADLVTALNATAINGAAFATDTFKLAETTDGRGDWIAEFWLLAPNGADLTDLYVDTVTDQGSSGSAVTVALIANGTLSRSVAPTVVSAFG